MDVNGDAKKLSDYEQMKNNSESMILGLRTKSTV